MINPTKSYSFAGNGDRGAALDPGNLRGQGRGMVLPAGEDKNLQRHMNIAHKKFNANCAKRS